MNSKFKVTYSQDAVKFLRKNKDISRRILSWVDDRLKDTNNPRLWGEALTGNLGAFWKYRIGDFRLICEIKDNELLVIVIKIGHRKKIYE